MPFLFGANSKTLPYNGKTNLGFLSLVFIVLLYLPRAGQRPAVAVQSVEKIRCCEGQLEKKYRSLRRQRLKELDIIFYIHQSKQYSVNV